MARVLIAADEPPLPWPFSAMTLSSDEGTGEEEEFTRAPSAEPAVSSVVVIGCSVDYSARGVASTAVEALG